MNSTDVRWDATFEFRGVVPPGTVGWVVWKEWDHGLRRFEFVGTSLVSLPRPLRLQILVCLPGWGEGAFVAANDLDRVVIPR